MKTDGKIKTGCCGSGCDGCSLDIAPDETCGCETGKKRSVFFIENMDCSAEEQLIRKKLNGFTGIGSLSFDLINRTLTVEHDAEDSGAVLSALQEIGMKVSEKKPGAESGKKTSGLRAVPPRERALLAFSGLAALTAEIFVWAGGAENSAPVITLALLSIASGGYDTIKKGWLAVKNLTVNINFLMILAVAGAAVLGKWTEAAVVIFLFALSELIESLSLDHARNSIRGLMAMKPERARIRDAEGNWKEVPAGEVKRGTAVTVRPGERIPLDGTVISGHSSVNQAPITGESMPVEKKTGDKVFAGTVNGTGLLEFRVTAENSETTLARIIRSVQEAQSQRAPTQRFIDSFARYYTPAVVVFALITALVPPLVSGGQFGLWLYRGLVILVISCPCALVISTPVTVVSGLAAAAKHGILVKGGLHLENGRKLKAIALDKTGTLTAGRPEVTDTAAFNGYSEKEILRLAAAVDSVSEHPAAAAIRAKWAETGETLPEPENFQALTGRGASAVVEGKKYYVGNKRMTEESGAAYTGPEEKEFSRIEKEGRTAVAVISEGKIIGLIGIGDTVRESGAEAVKRLKKLGIRPVLLTGDNQITADAVAARAGIEDARGNLLPEDKLSAIDVMLRDFGKVGMAGDGINDAPALAKATVGFAMGAAGTDTAIETADVALMDDDLRKLPDFIKISRDTVDILTENIIIAVGIKVLFLALAFSGAATLFMAVFADVGTSLMVIFNGLRMAYKKY